MKNKNGMKQVNILMNEELLEHLEKFAQFLSLKTNKKITLSDVIRDAVEEYAKYEEIVIHSQRSENDDLFTIQTQILPKGVSSSMLKISNDNKDDDNKILHNIKTRHQDAVKYMKILCVKWSLRDKN